MPTSGGSTLAVVDGRIGFQNATFQFAASSLDLTGNLRIGEWLPDFDFRIRSRDLGELDRIFQNFAAAGGNPHKPLGLGGTGEVSGHIGKSWSDPEVTAQVSAESARFADVLFGSVRGSADMHEGAFLFHPLRVYEGDATVSLEGTSRFRRDPKRPDLDLTLTAKDYPVKRFLDFLDLDYPITGRVTGSFPLSGNPPDAVSGEGLAVIEDAVLWGQKVERVTGRLGLTPGHVSFEDVRAELQGGAAGGRASLAFKEKTFEVQVAGDGIALSSIRACGSSPRRSGPSRSRSGLRLPGSRT